ncbi:Hydroquinone glucosyltransferase [Morella rubra]|uniref:Hydroquinone glucosyltransferase n=1 Tax=Morella rubra TaxID=262757 RepID=A0A6A1WN52_9ROSI|nr:Hydroquinone glucosyltransferase [Morella rubra]
MKPFYSLNEPLELSLSKGTRSQWFHPVHLFRKWWALSFDHLTELALGLELSGQRFVWVVRSPNNGPADAAYVGNRSHKDPLACLPNGFGERIEGRGLVVPSWAPQTRILRHGSIGGFLTHCGWNSTLESIASGIPLIVWPLFAEQRMNAV